MSILTPGEIINESYKIIKLLNEGGMNRVYLCVDISNGSTWALKVTRPPEEVDMTRQQIYTQFLKEISILTTLKHRSLPTIHDYFTIGDCCYVVEEYMSGTSLGEFIKHNLPSELEVLDWSIELCDILAFLHKEKIIYRDLKPDNIILTRDGTIKLIDFDISRYHKDGQKTDTILLGTPGYAAPETYGISQSDARSDIYSLGATMHHLLTGVNPQDKPFAFPKIGGLRHGIDSQLVRIVTKALDMKPENRIKSASEMKVMLLGLKSILYPADTNTPLLSAAKSPTDEVWNIVKLLLWILFIIIRILAGA